MMRRLAAKHFQVNRQMKIISVITFAEQDVSSRIAQTLSYARLEGLEVSAKDEDLVKKVVAGTVSVEQALLDLNKIYKVKTRPRRRARNVR